MIFSYNCVPVRRTMHNPRSSAFYCPTQIHTLFLAPLNSIASLGTRKVWATSFKAILPHIATDERFGVSKISTCFCEIQLRLGYCNRTIYGRAMKNTYDMSTFSLFVPYGLSCLFFVTIKVRCSFRGSPGMLIKECLL